MLYIFFFFKQKTAYEMRISDWSSDVCSSDLQWRAHMAHTLAQFGVGLGACHSEFVVTPRGPVLVEINYRSIGDNREFLLDQLVEQGWFKSIQIGRASCRERVCQYV